MGAKTFGMVGLMTAVVVDVILVVTLAVVLGTTTPALVLLGVVGKLAVIAIVAKS